MVNTSQQVGGAVGTAVLSTIFTHATESWVRDHERSASLAADAAVHGYTSAFTFAAVLFAVGLVIAVVVLPRRVQPPRPQAEPVVEGA